MPRKINLTILALFVLLGIYFARVRTVGDTADTYWHLAVGRQVWQQKEIPKTDDFIYGKADTHYTSTEWLSGLIFFLFDDFFGFKSLVILRIACALSTIFFLYKTVEVFTKDEKIQFAVLAATGYPLAVRLFDRPENFSYLFVALINYVCFKYFFKGIFSKSFYALPAIFLTWPSIHAFVVYGYALLSFWITIFVFEHFRKVKSRPNFMSVISIWLVSTIAILIQAKRFFFFLELKKLTSFSVNEWGSLTDRIFLSRGYQFFQQMPVEVYFYVFLSIVGLILAIHWIAKKRENNLSLYLIFATYFAISLTPIRYYRLIPLVLLTVAPLIIFFLKDFKNQVFDITVKLVAGFLIILTLGSIFVGYTIGSKSYFKASFDESGKTIGVKSRLWGQVFPQQTSTVIEGYLTTKHLYTFDWWSNFFIWRNPTVQTYSDVMYQYRTPQDFQDDQIIGSGQEGWDRLVEKYNIDTVVNSQFAAPKGNNTPVYKLSNWKLVYVDNISALWARNDVIKTLPVDLSALSLEIQEPLKFKPENKNRAIDQLQNLLKFYPKNDFARGQLIQNYIDESKITEAKSLAEESRKLMPNDPTFPLYLSAVYASSGNCQQASQFSKESLQKSYNDFNFQALEAIILSSCQSQNQSL